MTIRFVDDMAILAEEKKNLKHDWAEWTDFEDKRNEVEYEQK